MTQLDPITRKERIISGEPLTPLTREEKILSGEEVEPANRHEYFLQKAIGEGGGGEGGIVPVRNN